MSTLDEARTVGSFLRALAAEHGEREFIVHGDRRLRYADAERESARIARGLLLAGVGKGCRVGVLFPNGPDWVLAWAAAARIGAIVVPINTFYQPRELGWIVHHADLDTLICANRFLGHDYPAKLEEIAPSLCGQRAGTGGRLVATELPFLRQVFVRGDDLPTWGQPLAALGARADGQPELGEEFLRAAEAAVAPADPHVIIYSSGSTADPKGAIHTHGVTLRHAANLNGFRDLVGSDRMYTPMPFFWVGGFVFSLLSAMHAGACVLTEEQFEPGATLEMLERERATLVAGWPHYAKAMLEHPSFGERDLSSVRGGNLYAILPEAARPADPELRATSLGMTETCGPHTFDYMDVDLPEKLRGSFGKSVPGLEHKIIDPESGATLAAGESGEICVRGYSLMQGLYKLEREAVFDPDGFYRTGDGGHFDAEGHLFFEGRLGDLIKTAGANVTPREVEVLLEALPAVKEAFVVGVPHPDRGENVAAALVLRAGQRATRDEIVAALKAQLSAYKLPRHVFFAADGELPFTDSGKIDKRRLREQLAARIEAGEPG